MAYEYDLFEIQFLDYGCDIVTIGLDGPFIPVAARVTMARQINSDDLELF